MIKINEIFYSIQGESSYVGLPTVFVRTSGCNLRCTYCDTTYSYYDGNKFSIEQLIEKIKSYDCKNVCITGGEPLLQKEVLPLMTQLCDLGFDVSIETSGERSCKDVDSRVKKIIDVKTPDSGEADTFNLENLKLNDNNSEFKFVICSEKDFHWAEEFVAEHDLTKNYNVLYSPSFEKINEKWLAEKILSKKSSVRLQLQLHKYIWNPEQKGV